MLCQIYGKNVIFMYHYMFNITIINHFKYEDVAEMLAEHLERYIPYLIRRENTEHVV
jgi:hypothetical protein